MTKRDFFVTAIKLTALILAISNLSKALVEFSTFFTYWEIAKTLLLTIVPLIFLIFRADKVVDLLKLEQNMEEERIEFSGLKGSDIISIGTILFGAWFFLVNLTVFITSTFHLVFETTILQFDREDLILDTNYWWVNTVGMIIGLLLLRNHKLVGQIVDRISKAPKA